MKKAVKNILCFIWKIFFQKRNQNQLFLMGHPRSGSSLLMHILTSNNEIVGYGEYLIKYTNLKSFDVAEFDIRRKAGKLFGSFQYLANQINHHSITPNLELLDLKNIKFIILLRKPKETLSSIFLLAERKQKPMSQDDITDLYLERLQFLSTFIETVEKSQWIFTSYETLINDKEKELKKLSDFLKLNKSLTPNYQLKSYTQIWGDPSENIKKGAIFNTNSTQIPWNNNLLEEAEKMYETTISKLMHL